jgi:hypothetical protein
MGTQAVLGNSSFFYEVQIQDVTGNWRTVAATQSDPQIYTARMREAATNHPGSRIRVIDQSGRLVDML